MFATTAEVTGYIYRDPMGALIPRYERTPIEYINPITAPRCGYECGLSWLHDTTNQREDIMSKQMSRMNSEKWSARWGDET